MSLLDVKAPRFKLEHLMALDVADAGTLKSNVVHLLLQHPQGIKYGDFAGAFYKLHGYQPQLALHGYSSLTDLLTDMKNVVVLEKNSQATVVKIASSAPLNHWLKERKEFDSLMDEEAGGERTTEESSEESPAATYSQDGFVLIRDVIGEQPKGLKLKKLTKILNEKHEFDLQKFRVSLGYKNTLSFLEEIPGLRLQKCQNLKHCVIKLKSASISAGTRRLTEGPRNQEPDVFVLIRDVIEEQPKGMKLHKLKQILNKNHGFDLEKFRVFLGYKNTFSFLEEIPGLLLQECQKLKHCVIQLQSGVLQRRDRTQEGRRDEEDSERGEVQQQVAGNIPVPEEQPENIDAPRGESLPEDTISDKVEDRESRPLTSRQVTNPSTSAKGFGDVCATIARMEKHMIQTFNKFHTRISHLENRVAQNSHRLRILERSETERSETAETLSRGQDP